MNTPEQQERSVRAYQRAMEIIDQSWLAAGKTREELDQEEQLLELYDELLGSGRMPEDIRAEWKDKSNAEILRAYAAPALMQKSA